MRKLHVPVRQLQRFRLIGTALTCDNAWMDQAFYSFYGQLCDQMGRRLQDAGGTAPSSSPMISQWWARPGSVLATKGMLPRASSYETGLATLMSDPKSRAPSRAAPANGRSGNALASPRGPPEARSSGMNSINRNLRGQGERLATIQASISGSWSCGLTRSKRSRRLRTSTASAARRCRPA